MKLNNYAEGLHLSLVKAILGSLAFSEKRTEIQDALYTVIESSWDPEEFEVVWIAMAQNVNSDSTRQFQLLSRVAEISDNQMKSKAITYFLSGHVKRSPHYLSEDLGTLVRGLIGSLKNELNHLTAFALLDLLINQILCLSGAHELIGRALETKRILGAKPTA